MRTHIDLFSGIGGFSLAAKWAGIKTVQFVEIDPFCRKVLNKNFPGVPIHDDIKTFTNTDRSGSGTPTSGTDGNRQEKNKEQRFSQSESSRQNLFLITGGFPCQPFSCAGKRKGTEDDRHLWPEMLRVIKEFKPTWIIGENVAGIRSMELVNSDSAVESNPDIQEDGENDYTTVLDGICNDLEGIGYEVQPIIIPACAVNAPHRRDRVWIVGNAKVKGRELRGQRSGDSPQPKEGIFGCTDSHAPDTEKSKCELSGRTRTGREGFTDVCFDAPDSIEVATRLCGVDDEVASRVDRLKAIGNGQVSVVAATAFKILTRDLN